MKSSDVVREVLAGRLLVVAEYRSFKPDSVRMRDKASGQTVIKPKVLHSLEFGDVQVTISEWLPDGVSILDAKPPFNKGQKVVVRMKTLEPVNFGASYTMTGALEPLEADDAAPANAGLKK